MVGATFVFALMGAVIKHVSAWHSAFEVVFYRGAVSALLMGAWIYGSGRSVRTRRIGLHASRSLLGTTAMACWFSTFATLPLATSVTLNYTSPLFIALMVAVAGWWQGRSAPMRGWLNLAIAASFVGVLMILRPAIERDHVGVLMIGLLSGLLAAIVYLQVRRLSQLGEPDWVVVFWFAVTNIAFGAVAATLTGWHPVEWRNVGFLLLIGVLASMGQMMMTRAFGRGRTLLTANLQYLGVIFATFIGWIAFDDRFEWIEFAGILLIVASGAVATRVSSGSPVPAARSGRPATT
jgi:S-adenosylmethionine uptake transporter